MVDEDLYCPDILIQVSAATNALNSFNKELTGFLPIDKAMELVNVLQKVMK